MIKVRILSIPFIICRLDDVRFVMDDELDTTKEEEADNDETNIEPEELEPSGNDNARNRAHSCVYEYPEEWISDVTTFCCEDNAIKAVNEYQRINCCALAHIRGGGRPDLENGKKGKLNLGCIHGIDNKRKRNKKPMIRKKQHTNFKGCRMRIFIRQQLSGVWILRTFIPSHVRENGDVAHLSGADVFKMSRQAKQAVEVNAMEYIKEFKSVNAPTRAVADRVGQLFNVNYTSKDIVNRVRKVVFDSDKTNVGVFLDEVVKGGGKVHAKYHTDSEKCRVLCISTQYMQADLKMTRPKVFVNDTTFSTNDEGFKVREDSNITC